MKTAYTLIELLIVISLIALMAVTAIPAFSDYGKKVELDNKAEEIKYLIEKAYADAVSPAIGTNGSLVELSAGPSSEIRVKKGLFSDECRKNINDNNCAFTSIVGNEDIIEIGRNDSLQSVAIRSISIIKDGNIASISPVSISFVSPISSDSVYACDSSVKNNKIYNYNGLQGMNCNNNKDQITIMLGSEVGVRGITINRNPFSVKITKS